MSFFYNKRQFIFLACVLGLGLVLSISGFVVLDSRADLEPWQPWTLLTVGLLLTGLLLAYITAALGRTATVERLVGLRTQELSQANGQLMEEVAVRRQIESRLQGSEAGIRAILDATVDGIITMDEEGTIESFNAAAENIFGYPAADILGEPVEILMAEPGQHAQDAHLGQYMWAGDKKGLATDREARGRRRDGATFPMNIAATAVSAI